MNCRKFIIFDKIAVERERWSSLLAIGNGLKLVGSEIEYFTPNCFNLDKGDIPITPIEKIDGVFTWGYNYLPIQEYYFGKNINVFTVDRAFLCREKGYAYILKNNKFTENKPSDRFDKLELKFNNSAWKEDGHILVCLQNHDLDWYEEAINILHQNVPTTREIRIRPYDSEIPLKSDLKGAFALVTYNSTCLYSALLNKIPIYCSEKCPAANSETAIKTKAISTNLTEINNSVKVENPEIFLYNVAYNQYTLDEMREGIFYNNLVF